MVEHSRDPLAGVEAVGRARRPARPRPARSTRRRTAAEAARDACRETGSRAGLATACWIAGRVAQSAAGPRRPRSRPTTRRSTASTTEPFEREIRRQRAGMLAGTGPSRATRSTTWPRRWRRPPPTATNDVAMTARYHLAMAYLNAGRPLDAADLLEEMLDGDRCRRCRRPSRCGTCSPRRTGALDQPDQAIEQLELIAASGAGERIRRAGRRDVRADRADPGPARPGHARGAAVRGGVDGVPAGRHAAGVRAYRPPPRTSHMWADQLDEAVEALDAGRPGRAGHHRRRAGDPLGAGHARPSMAPGSWRSAATWTPRSSGARPTIDGLHRARRHPTRPRSPAPIHGEILVQAGRARPRPSRSCGSAIANGDDDARRRAAHVAGPSAGRARPRRTRRPIRSRSA